MEVNKNICEDCLNSGEDSTKMRGFLIIEIILWLLRILPGVIYSLWRRTGRNQICKKCGSCNIVPENSIKGKDLLKRIK